MENKNGCACGCKDHEELLKTLVREMKKINSSEVGSADSEIVISNNPKEPDLGKVEESGRRNTSDQNMESVMSAELGDFEKTAESQRSSRKGKK